MASKKSKKQQGGEDKQEKKPRRGKLTVVASESAREPEPTVLPAESGPKRANKSPRKATEPSKSQTTTTPTSDDASETVVFALRMARSERDELHKAVGSGKSSKFVRAIILAGVRGDTKTLQELVDSIHASR